MHVALLFFAYVRMVSPCAQASRIDARVLVARLAVLLVARLAVRTTTTSQLMEEKLAAYRSP